MKQLFSISLSLLILLSGMHLSIAAHFCEGNLAASKLSFAEEQASCGMEHNHFNVQTISSNCCQNEVLTYSVDNNYQTSSFQVTKVAKLLLQEFNIPLQFVFQNLSSPLVKVNVSPPDIACASAVSLDNICIFRI